MVITSHPEAKNVVLFSAVHSNPQAEKRSYAAGNTLEPLGINRNPKL